MKGMDRVFFYTWVLMMDFFSPICGHKVWLIVLLMSEVLCCVASMECMGDEGMRIEVWG